MNFYLLPRIIFATTMRMREVAVMLTVFWPRMVLPNSSKRLLYTGILESKASIMRFAGRPSEVTCVTVITRMVSEISLIIIVLMFSIRMLMMVWSCQEPGVNWERIEFQDIECWRRGQLWWKYIDYDYETHAIVSLYLPRAYDLFSSYRHTGWSFFLKK